MDNRDRILDESLRLFAEKGYSAVGIQEIVDNSSVTKPTLYHYFGSKEGLFQALLERDFNPFLELLEGAALSDDDIFPKMKRVLELFLGRCVNQSRFIQIYLHISFSPPQSEESRGGNPYIRRIERMMEDMFIGASYRHGNMKGRHREYSSSWLGLLNNCAVRMLRGDIENSGDFIQKTVHQFAHGIYS